MNRKTFLFFIFILTLTIFAPASNAQKSLSPGSPDPTFGVDGRVLSQMDGGGCGLGDAILMPDGKILALCTRYQSRGYSSYIYFLLVRYLPDGSPDASFGEGGIKIIPVAEGVSISYHGAALRLLPDGKILIGGTFNRDFGLMRVNADGSPDTSFGIGGIVKTDFSDFEESSAEHFAGLIIRPDGKLLVYGKSIVENLTYSCTNTICGPPQFERLALAQYNEDGSPDMSFGVGGKQKSRFANDTHMPEFLIVEPDGKLLFFAFVYDVAWGAPIRITHVAARYNADGSLDTSYGKEGVEGLPDMNFYPLPDGKLLAMQLNPPNVPGPYFNTRFMRYNSDFTADASFGVNGFADYLIIYQGRNVHLQPDGKFISVGASSTKTYFYRFNANGGVDFTFGTNGAIGFDLDGSSTLENSGVSDRAGMKILTQTDGKILVVGAFFPPQNTIGIRGIAMMRFIGENGKRGATVNYKASL